MDVRIGRRLKYSKVVYEESFEDEVTKVRKTKRE